MQEKESFRHIGLIGRPGSNALVEETVLTLINFFDSRNISVILDEETFAHIKAGEH